MTDLAVFLAKLVRAQLNKETVPPIPEGVKLTEIVDIAVDHKMVYFFLVPLLTADIDEPSQKYLPAIKALIFKSMSKTLAQANELKKLIDIFEENEIINQPMKGAIMKFLYPSPEMREMGDVDILVREEDMERAMSLLQENGYIWNDDKKHDHHKVFTKAPHMYLEVHRALYDKKVDATQYEYFKDISKRNLREGCKYTYDFSKEDFYVYMIAHMAKHFYINGCGIRNLVDMHVYNQLYGAELNRAYIDVELEKCGIASFEKHISELTEIWLNGKESSPFYDNLFDYMLGSGFMERVRILHGEK